MSGRKRVVYDTRFIAAIYYPKDDEEAASLWKKYNVPMADAMIAATAFHLRADCVSNDEHFSRMKGLRLRWV